MHFSAYINQTAVVRLETVKLAQAGFGNFLADARVSRLKGKRDDNKEV